MSRLPLHDLTLLLADLNKRASRYPPVNLSLAKISPAQRVHLAKDQTKSNLATALLATEGSTGATGEYLRLWKAAGRRVNLPQLNDLLFVSSNGLRSGAKPPPLDLIRRAIDTGALGFLGDSPSRRPEGGNSYNVGEQKVADLLRTLNHKETPLSPLVSLWTPTPQAPSTSPTGETPPLKALDIGRKTIFGNPFFPRPDEKHMGKTLPDYKAYLDKRLATDPTFRAQALTLKSHLDSGGALFCPGCGISTAVNPKHTCHASVLISTLNSLFTAPTAPTPVDLSTSLPLLNLTQRPPPSSSALLHKYSRPSL